MEENPEREAVPPDPSAATPAVAASAADAAAPVTAVASVAAEVRDRARHAVLIEAGPFRMGSEDADRNPGDGESPVRSVEVPAFRIDPACVTNAEFAAFVQETGYVTEAEEFGWSFVFGGLLEPELRRASRKPPGTPWWRAVEQACWSAPEGPGSSVRERGEHPVVHVSLRDAEAFAAWCGMRLPREAEWEKAARGGLDQARYAWGEELAPGGEHLCNIWQGAFPLRNTLEDGFLGTAPVRSFPPNGFGLYEVAGNVWEWCSDPWETGGATSLTGDVRVMRGGSYLCHDSYCNRYRVAARSSTAAEDSSGNKGFRLAMDA
ncbi:formylglycine-generating enzyme family protein [Brachybacterium sp.]|uniref:formylglycine-generating enzyme family protein n=1 Tax=Brachybacterium sp. TaxID=1891286 RepID=UPI002ED6A623